MKLDYEPIKIERSEDFEEEVFGISDVTVIMEILRSKLYSNPIKVLVQEYMSNARDAHREIGNENVPIEVTCPTDMNPQFEVRDYGPGLTPHRISNVFIKYGSSTKRDSNNQTGGFGIGAKSGWSYSDTFQVISITKEKGGNVKRAYSCIVDESRAGKLVKLSDPVLTDERCGTRIIVPAKKENFRQFKAYAIQAGTFWKTQPIIFGETIVTPKTISEGTNWKYFDRSSLPSDFATNHAFVVYDGIPYPLKTETLKDSINNTVMQVLNSASFGLYFNIGDITISANREEIQYTEKTRIELAKRVNELVEDVASKFTDTIQKEPTFVSALIKFNGICKENDVVAKLINDAVEWNGIKLHEMNQFATSSGAVKIENFYYEGGKLCHKKGVYVSFSDASILDNIYINDEPLRGAPKAKFESMCYHSANKDDFDVYVISFHTNNIKGLSPTEITTANARIKKWKEETFINELNLKKTSSVKKNAYTKFPNQPKIPSGKVVKYRSITLNSDNSGIYLEEHEDFDSSLTGYYVINHDGHIKLGGHHYNIRDRYETRSMTNKFKIICKFLKINKILVFTPKYTKLLSENKVLIPLPHDVQTDIVKSYDYNKIKDYIDHLRNEKTYSHNFFNILDPNKYVGRFDPNSKVAKKLASMIKCKQYETSADFKEISQLYSEYSCTIEALYKLNVSISEEKEEDKFAKRYPLLVSTNWYTYNNDNEEKEKFIDHAISYINLVDKAKI